MRHQTSNHPWWVQLFYSARAVPLDLVAAVGYLLAVDLLYGFAAVRGTLAQPLLALPTLFFVPGYVLLAALFPGRAERAPPEDAESSRIRRRLAVRGIDTTERLALSFGLSVALLPIFALVLAALPWGFDPGAILGLLTVFVVVGALAGVIRRFRLPEEQRYGSAYHLGVGYLLRGGSRTDTVLNVVLLLSVVLAVSTAAYAIATPSSGESYTSFYLATEGPSGDLVASGFPTTFTAGEGEPLVVGVENHEGTATTYTIVVELQRVEVSDQAVTVVETEELARMQPTVEPDETWTNPHVVVPEMTGEQLRLQYYLYKGDAPANPDGSTAYRQAYIWVDVTDSSA